jgi:hypothetical protein
MWVVVIVLGGGGRGCSKLRRRVWEARTGRQYCGKGKGSKDVEGEGKVIVVLIICLSYSTLNILPSLEEILPARVICLSLLMSLTGYPAAGEIGVARERSEKVVLEPE